DGDRGLINAESVRVRPGPSTDNNTSPPLGRYKDGEQVRILGQQGDWTEIRAPKTIGAWIKIEDITEYRDTAENRRQQWQQSLADGL
ncbi:MAG: SH3 domain-containing protein, partial [Gammaproteobacteria bacterium]